MTIKQFSNRFHTLLLLTLLVLVSPSVFSQEAEMTVGAIRFSGLHAIPEDVAFDVVGLSQGEGFTYEKLENSLNNLRKWGVFSKVEVLVEKDGSIANLNFDLVEGYIVKDIKIKGNYPLLEREVRRTLFISAGEIYDNGKMQEQIDRLDRLYEKEGYFNSTIFAIEDYDNEKREVTLTFKIQKGTTYRLRGIEVEGNTALNPGRVRNILFTYFRYKPKQVKKDMEKIQGIYKKKGYVRARVKLNGETYDYDARKVDINVGIRQGKHVFVEFKGNDHFFNRTLLKELTIYEDGDFDDYELEASKSRLVDFYKLKGYENVEISFDRKKLDAENFLVTFNIQEGKQKVIKKIEFSGNEQVKAKKLRQVMVSKEQSLNEKGYFIEPLVQEDVKLIEDYYHSEGFLDAKIENWDKDYNSFGNKVILTINIDESARAEVASFEIEGLKDEYRKQIEEELLCKPGEAYSPSRLTQDVQSILVVLSNNGYPYASVERDVQSLGDNRYSIKLKADPGEEVTIGRILFVGNSLTKESVLRKNLRFKEGSVFSTQQLLQSQINLRRLGVFDRVTIETLGITNKEKVVNALVSLQEKKTKIIDLEAGYNTDSGFTGKLIFNKLNVWGSGKNFNVKVQAGQEISQFEINYIDPRLNGSSLQLVTGGFIGFQRRPFFENFFSGIFSTLFKDFGPYLSTYGRLQFDFVDFDESKTQPDNVNPRENTQDRTRIQTTLGVTYDRRDNFGNPRKGYFLNGTVTTTNLLIQQGGNYLTTRATTGIWYSPFRRITFANAFRIAKIFLIPGSTVVPQDDRLYLGGNDTMRGFCQDCVLPNGGNFSFVDNLEMQINPFGNFQVVGFMDTGMDIASMTQFNLANLRHSAGAGVRYMTPVGPVRLEYGFNIDRQPGERLGYLHFSFGYFF